MNDIQPVNRKNIDLFDILTALDDRAAASTWYGSGLECIGNGAEELYSITDKKLPLTGNELLRITSQIYQTIDGDLKAFENNAEDPWILIRAWDGTGFYFETLDPQIKELFKSRFGIFEDVEAEYQPKSTYVNFFLNFYLCE
jgi:hypothetical protein